LFNVTAALILKLQKKQQRKQRNASTHKSWVLLMYISVVPNKDELDVDELGDMIRETTAKRIQPNREQAETERDC